MCSIGIEICAFDLELVEKPINIGIVIIAEIGQQCTLS